MSMIIFYDPSFPIDSRISSNAEGQLLQIGGSFARIILERHSLLQMAEAL